MTYDQRPHRLGEAIYFTRRINAQLVATPERLDHYRQLLAEGIASGEIETCPACEGTGVVQVPYHDTYRGRQMRDTDCGKCRGLSYRVSAFHVQIKRSRKKKTA